MQSFEGLKFTEKFSYFAALQELRKSLSRIYHINRIFQHEINYHWETKEGTRKIKRIVASLLMPEGKWNKTVATNKTFVDKWNLFYWYIFLFFQEYSIMATAIQKNGMKPLTNGTLNHVENVGSLENGGSLCSDPRDGKCYKRPAEDEEITEEPPELDILIRNVVCNFSVRCHLNLREIALKGSNVEYRRENGVMNHKNLKTITINGLCITIWSHEMA